MEAGRDKIFCKPFTVPSMSKFAVTLNELISFVAVLLESRSKDNEFNEKSSAKVWSNNGRYVENFGPAGFVVLVCVPEIFNCVTPGAILKVNVSGSVLKGIFSPITLKLISGKEVLFINSLN